MPTLFLTGYEKETINEFLLKLKKAQIDLIIDVREIPLSRKYGFSKLMLSKLLENEGISYMHFPKLGSPKVIRHELRNDGDYIKFFIKYRVYAKQNTETISRVIKIIETNKHSALMCFEKHCDQCHRSILASEILKLRPLLRVTPI